MECVDGSEEFEVSTCKEIIHPNNTTCSGQNACTTSKVRTLLSLSLELLYC